ncbi:MAG: hypothetical protein PHR21_04900 [Oscillospiraceae bacterium]|nr:hypothetical protein [Oscillospiraceae bacterium]MDD4367361.1 hypothetical protein [Oscillospiraceae bacterium]
MSYKIVTLEGNDIHYWFNQNNNWVQRKKNAPPAEYADRAQLEANLDRLKSAKKARYKIVETESGGLKNGNAQNGNAQNGNAQNSNSQNGNAQNGNAQNSNSQNGNSQNGNVQNNNAQNGNAQNNNARQESSPEPNTGKATRAPRLSGSPERSGLPEPLAQPESAGRVVPPQNHPRPGRGNRARRHNAKTKIASVETMDALSFDHDEPDQDNWDDVFAAVEAEEALASQLLTVAEVRDQEAEAAQRAPRPVPSAAVRPETASAAAAPTAKPPRPETDSAPQPLAAATEEDLSEESGLEDPDHNHDPAGGALPAAGEQSPPEPAAAPEAAAAWPGPTLAPVSETDLALLENLDWLQTCYDVFSRLDSLRAGCRRLLHSCDRQTLDFLHYIELTNQVDRDQEESVYEQLRIIRRQRRRAKDALDFLERLCTAMRVRPNKVKDLLDYRQRDRAYMPRERSDLFPDFAVSTAASRAATAADDARRREDCRERGSGRSLAEEDD